MGVWGERVGEEKKWRNSLYHYQLMRRDRVSLQAKYTQLVHKGNCIIWC